MHEKAEAHHLGHDDLPGARATTVRVPAFVNSLPRWVVRMNGSLASFVRSMLTMPTGSMRTSTFTSRSLLWPMPVPFPEVFVRRVGSPVANAWLKRLVSLQVAVMSWLALGGPCSAPASLCLGTRLSSSQWKVVNNLLTLNVDGNTPEFVDAGAMGRAASKFESAEDAVGALARAATALHVEEHSYFGSNLSKPTATFERPFRCGRPSGALQRSSMTTAKPLVAERLQFPGPPRFVPDKYFDERTAARYNFPLQLGRDFLQFEGVPPKVKVFADVANRVEIYKKLADSGRLLPVPAHLRRGPFCSGLFAVTKDLQRDRMVLDGRPANMLEEPLTNWCRTMASPVALAMIWLQPGHVLLASGEDLRDFFYQFVVPFERTARNVLSEPLTVEQARYVFGSDFNSDEEPVWVGLNSLAMGDSLACEFAQGSHTGLMLQHGVALSTQLLSLHNPIPRGLQHIGIIIDDLVVLEQIMVKELMHLREEGLATWGSSKTAHARKVYAEVGLETNPKKAFEDRTCSSFWGVDIDGEKGIMRASNSRLWPAMLVTLRVATLKLATVGLLESLAGTWVAIFGLRRRLFCLLDIIFEALAIEDQKAVIRLSDALVDELVTLVVMAPMAMVNLRACYAPFLIATDASMSGLAGVRAELSAPFSQELCRHALRKGTWAALLPPSKSWQKQHDLLPPGEELDDFEFSVHPLWELCARGCRFRTTWKARVENQMHINLLEMKAHLREERRLARSCFNMRIPAGLDSQVCLGALVKGRASAVSITRELKKNLGYGVGNDLYYFYMFFPSAMNRADGPSRDEAPKAPDVKLQTWWSDALAGEFHEMDKWLLDASEFDAFQQLPYDLLLGDEEKEMAPARSARLGAKQRRRRKARENGQTTPSVSFMGPLPEKTQRRMQILASFPRSQFCPAEGDLDLSAPGALDLFSGSYGVPRELVRLGCPWVLTFELKHSPKEDLTDEGLQNSIMELLELGAFEGAGMAPVCCSFSRAVTPAVRSRRFPRGLPSMSRNMREKVRVGNLLADFVLKVWTFCLMHGIGFWCENPDTSFMWLLKGWEAFSRADSLQVARLAFCRFGTTWRKNTRFGTNTAIAGLRLLCACGDRGHVRLRGYSAQHGMAWTKVAEPYPRGVCKLLAKALAVHAGWCHKDKLNIAGCCRAGSLRIGEATNPGPGQRPNRERVGSLENMPRLLPATLALEARLLTAFKTWCEREVKSISLDALLDKLPELLPFLLRRYGDLLFQSGGALSNLRHLVLAAQRWRPLARPYMQPCWELVARWEAQQPVTHRTPVPEALLKALCTIGWLRGWFAWTIATAVSFYGGARVGEVLRCSREDLLLPCDLAEDGVQPVFVRLRHFKSKFRNPAQVQHLRIEDRTTYLLLHKVFKNLDKAEPLFNTTPYQFRKRWNLLLSALEVPADALLTPGGLRGGFAVWSYRRGVAVQNIMWTMRLRSQVTLESYLQETASLNALLGMTLDARRALNAAAKVFPLLPAAAV